MATTEDQTAADMRALQDRLTRLSEASLRINEDLDYHSVLEEVTNSACVLTGAKYAATTVLDQANRLEEFVTSGLTLEEHRHMADLPGSAEFFRYLNDVPDPLRVNDLASYMESLGIVDWSPPVAIASLLVAPIRNKGVRLGSIYVTKGEAGSEFTREDEDTLVMFASQAALVIANARRYRDEQRARTDLEALIATCPVGKVGLSRGKSEAEAVRVGYGEVSQTVRTVRYLPKNPSIHCLYQVPEIVHVRDHHPYIPLWKIGSGGHIFALVQNRPMTFPCQHNECSIIPDQFEAQLAVEGYRTLYVAHEYL